MEIVLIWLLFGVVTAIAANARGYNAAGALVLGILGGPFALIGYLVAGRKQESPGQEHGASGRFLAASSNAVEPTPTEKKCPMCAETIKLEAVVCRFCGHKFSAEEVQARVAAAQAEAKQRVWQERLDSLRREGGCWRCVCGSLNEPTATYCRGCGRQEQAHIVWLSDSEWAAEAMRLKNVWQCPTCGRHNLWNAACACGSQPVFPT